MSRSDGQEYEKTICELNRRMDLSKNRNWLGHQLNTTAAKIDDILFDESTIEAMAKVCRTTGKKISRHLTHLRKEHGIPLKNESGKIIIDYKEMKKRIDSKKPPVSMKPIFEE